MDNNWLEIILKKNAKDKNICKVLSVQCEPAVSQGNNYASEMVRVKMKVVLGSGIVATKSIIVKQLPKLPSQLEFLKEYKVFHTETQAYTQILPRMEKLMIDHGDASDKLWCDLIAYVGEEKIVMEDLKELGFKNADRKKGLDMNHALLTVRALARLHALSAVLIHKGELDPSSSLPYSMARNKEMMNVFVSSGITTLVKVMRSYWDSMWADVANRLERFSETVNDKVEALYKQETNELVVFNHGDCWVNNVMYKCDLGNEKPIALRFVDFQESHCNTYGWDLIYLFYTSLNPKLRAEQSETLIEEYRKTLLAIFTFYDYVPENIPTLESIKDEFKRLRSFAVVLSASILPVLITREEDVVETDRLLDIEDEEAQHCRMNMYRTEEFTERIKMDLECFLEEGVF